MMMMMMMIAPESESATRRLKAMLCDKE